MQHPTSVLVSIALVSGRKYCDHLAIGEVLDAIHHAFVGAYYLLDVILLAERFDSVRAEFDNIARLVWISDIVGLYAFLFIRVSWI